MQSSDDPDRPEKQKEQLSESGGSEQTQPATRSKPSLSVQKEKRKTTGIPPQFPRLLHTMLSKSEEGGYNDIASWQPHGKSFLIHDRKRFVREVMPKYFKQTRFSSFQRQLNLYGFVRIERTGPDHKSYYHDRFLRDEPQLVETMGRIKSDSGSTFANWTPKPQPDFLIPKAASKPTVAQVYGDMYAAAGAAVPLLSLPQPHYALPMSMAGMPPTLQPQQPTRYFGPTLPPHAAQQQQQHQQPASSDREDLDRKLPAVAAPEEGGNDNDSTETASTLKDNHSIAHFLEDVDLDSDSGPSSHHQT